MIALLLMLQFIQQMPVRWMIDELITEPDQGFTRIRGRSLEGIVWL